MADGLRAEYLPYIIAVAKRQGYGIEKATVVRAKRPTTTSFNSIIWPETQLLKPSKAVDNSVHYGVEKNETSSYEEDLCALLQKIETIIIGDRVGNGLNQFDRVILTADHGASRLAVICANGGLAETIPTSTSPQDWRFTEEPAGYTEMPKGIQEVYREDVDKTYWVSKGYSRFSKSGGKMHQLHGGGSPEEVLVPYVAFVREKKSTISTVSTSASTTADKEQIIEDADFDVL